jgi:hypothetical protein
MMMTTTTTMMWEKKRGNAAVLSIAFGSCVAALEWLPFEIIKSKAN